MELEERVERIKQYVLSKLASSEQYGNPPEWRPMRCQGGSLGFGEVLIAEVLKRRPERILVIGSGLGFTPCILAISAQTYGGHVDFVDANYGSGCSGWWAFWTDHNVRWFMQHYKLNNLTFHRTTTQNFFANVVTSGYDMAFIDGDHTVEGVKFDVEQTTLNLRPKGLIIVHDVRMARPDNQAGTYWQTIPPELRETFKPMPGLGFYAPKGGSLPRYMAPDENYDGYDRWPWPRTKVA
jgi:hypothetical protein